MPAAWVQAGQDWTLVTGPEAPIRVRTKPAVPFVKATFRVLVEVIPLRIGFES